MLFHNTNTYLLALAAIPSFVLCEYHPAVMSIPLMLTVGVATDTELQARASKDLLFAEGGPSLDDIAIKDTKPSRSESLLNVYWRIFSEAAAETVAENATIFAQCLIALRKLNPNTITLWFDETIGEAEVRSKETNVKPYYKAQDEDGKKHPEIPISYDQALQDAGEISFGYTEDSAW